MPLAKSIKDAIQNLLVGEQRNCSQAALRSGFDICTVASEFSKQEVFFLKNQLDHFAFMVSSLGFLFTAINLLLICRNEKNSCPSHSPFPAEKSCSEVFVRPEKGAGKGCLIADHISAS